MIKDSLILFLFFLYFTSFFVWIFFFYNLLKKNPENKKKIYLVNISSFIAFTYLLSFLILEVLN